MGIPLRTAMSAAVLCLVASAGTMLAAKTSAAGLAPVPVEPCVHGRPVTNTTIGVAQNGKTVCISVGQELIVVLADPGTTELTWAPVEVWPPGILVREASTVMGPRGVTGANYVAKRRGTAYLSSSRSACPVPRGSQVACAEVLHWRVRVVVLAPPTVLEP